jgi:hypothetical protein
MNNFDWYPTNAIIVIYVCSYVPTCIDVHVFVQYLRRYLILTMNVSMYPLLIALMKLSP